MLRAFIFLLGCALMAISLFVPFVPGSADRRIGWSWLFSFGLLLAVASHGWPEGVL